MNDRTLKVTLSMVGGPQGLDIEVTIRKNPSWIMSDGMDAYVLELDGFDPWIGPTPGFVLDKAMLTLRTLQDEGLADLVSEAERKAGWDPHP